MWPEVREAMEPFLAEKYGNASTSYELGEQAGKAVEKAREQIAEAIDARPEEIFFTSGGSESDNWVIKMVAGHNKFIGSHVITSKIEHHAILNSCAYLERSGCEVTYLDVDAYGIVSPEQLERFITPYTALVSVMYANNEIGTMEPVKALGTIAHRSGIPFHTDAVQAVGQIPISLRNLPVDFLSASAHKFHGPKGVGFLYAKKGSNLPSFIDGGLQEHGRRAGTENVAGIVGMAEALRLSVGRMKNSMQKTTELRDYMIKRVLQECKGVRLNGHPIKRLPGNVNFSFEGVDASTLLVLLEEDGICASAGSACSSGKVSISHVIAAIGVADAFAGGTIRFTLGEENTREDVDQTIEALKVNVDLLRQI